ncbi:Fe superoxide dismutase [Cordyceps fumosorosea ARSEF 2679]|uniref:Fe superoxide dismutase n=1 Tax=Cordyceps fumosorosea (strain ARSEF 2679) TaxID=1081104 RepID=A0A168EN57_CORFA|nr:Fe superoxide dismutase [Cordyceps fumosorosea ARSEF 2679]OAA74013.1 Fe superoxide dismutase [Cordyceps fumosorosea ARSEF 2679]
MFRSRLRTSGLGLAQSLRPSTTSTAPRFAAPLAARAIHHVPTLAHDFSEGVPSLMSPGGFNIAWSEYMALTVEKLNALTAGTELEDKDAKTIALMTAREPNQAPIFNYASMAHNNHFFFQGIAPAPVVMPEQLRAELEASFSSVETLRREMILTASAMFGPGFVWLVKTGPAAYRVLSTYLAGSPYPGAHWRAQPTDMNTVGDQGSARSYFRNQLQGAQHRAGNLPPGGIELQPLLCLNTWEHAWLLDWGVGAGGSGGKAGFAEAWWELVDWELVSSRAGLTRQALKGAN